MIKDKCCREINDSLQKTFAKSVLNKFASNLGIDIYNDGSQQKISHAKDTQDVEEEKDPFLGMEEEESMDENEKEAEDVKKKNIAKYV